MARVWNAPIFAIATVYFAADALFSAITGPITRWLSKKRLPEKVRRWVTSLGPYQSFALFAVPAIILEPAKPLSAYLIGTGHFLPGRSSDTASTAMDRVALLGVWNSILCPADRPIRAASTGLRIEMRLNSMSASCG